MNNDIKIGSIWVEDTIINGPWGDVERKPTALTVIDVKEGWVRYKFDKVDEFEAKPIEDFIAYIKVMRLKEVIQLNSTVEVKDVTQ